MKQTITLTAFFVLVTFIAFGQKTEFENKVKFGKSSAEKHLKVLVLEVRKDRPERIFQPNRYVTQNSVLKLAQTIKQRFDSLIEQRWDESTSQWVADYKKEFTYDASGNVTQVLDYDWDESTSQWVADDKEEYTYDANGDMTQSLYYDWDESTSQWVADDKEEYTYDANGDMTQSLYYDWDECTSQWVADYKKEFTYDASGNVTQVLDYDWDESTSQWVADDKEEYTYDANGDMTQSLYYDWDECTSQWVADYKEEFTYDASGNVTQVLYYDWDESASQWVADDKDEYTYDANGDMTQSLDYDWDESTSQWVADDKDEYTYDANGDMTQFLDYDWDESTSQWVADYKEEYAYDNMYSYNDLILPFFSNDEEMSIFFVHKLISVCGYDNDESEGTWVGDYKTTLYYSNQNVTSVNNVETEIFKLYPNPVSEDLTFSISGNYKQITFELFNVQGCKVMTKEIKNTETISIESLNNGVYFYNILTDEKRQSGKLMKE